MVTGPRDMKDWGKARLFGRWFDVKHRHTVTTSSVPLLPAIPICAVLPSRQISLLPSRIIL